MELQLNEYFDRTFQVLNGSGAAVDADALPTFRIYAEGTDTPIETGNAAKRDDANTTGYYVVRTQLTAAKGYAVGTIYEVRVVPIVNTVAGAKVIGAFLIVPADVIREGDLDGMGAGTGARTVTVTVNDGAVALQSVRVRLTKGAESKLQVTDVSGRVTFNLDDGTWTVALTLSGYIYAGTTLVVDGPETPTYSMTQVSFPASDPGFITGYLYCYNEQGVAEPGVTVQIRCTELDGHGVAFDTKIRSGISDGAGLVSFTNLIKGASYQVRRGTSARWTQVTIPADAASPYALDDVGGDDA